MSFNRVLEKLASSSETGEETETVKQSSKSSVRLQRLANFQRKFELKGTMSSKKESTFLKFLYLFLTAAKPSETILVCTLPFTLDLIIIAA
jgi:hypothetical protein